VNEGGATIVFAYGGPFHPIFSDKVLRLRKSIRSHTGKAEPDEPDDPSIAFQTKVTSRLIPSNCLPTLTAILLNKTWLESLARFAEEARPISRRAKDHLDTSRSKGVLATNLIQNSGLSVEIKPKWGFLPNLKYLSPENRTTKSRHCRYCMHSSLRVANGEAVSHGYCPLDLFSPQEARIRRAVTTLWQAWIDSDATTNNLRIFLDGSRVKPNSDVLSRICSSLNDDESSIGDPSEVFAAALTSVIIGSPLLQTLQRLQRNLDSLDIEGLLKLWLTVRGNDAPSSSFSGVLSFEPTMDDWSNFIDRYLSANPPTPDDLSSQQDLRFFLLSYLLSATFKDCSVIAKFQQKSSEAQLFLIDLDPKSILRLDRWLEQDQEIVQAFQQRLLHEHDISPCVDDNLVLA